MSLSKHKSDKAMGAYADALQSVYASEADFFKEGSKFMPFAKSYIESGFDSKMAPIFSVDVTFRDYKLSPAARTLLNSMKRPWHIHRTKYAKGYKMDQRSGPYAYKDITFEEARKIWETRNSSVYGAYHPSRSGFRNSTQAIFDDNGLGFCLMVGGHDERRGGREEYHVIDDDKDWSEVVNMMAVINRSRIQSIK